MSKHVWLVKQYQRDTLAIAMIAYHAARGVGNLDIPEACCFVGYAMESVRQSGRGKAGGDPLGFTSDRDGSGAITQLWNRVARSGHRYSRGKNGSNYGLAGRRLLAQRLRMAYDPPEGEPMLGALIKAFEDFGEWQPLHDYLEERAVVGGYEAVRQVLATGLPLLFVK